MGGKKFKRISTKENERVREDIRILMYKQRKVPDAPPARLGGSQEGCSKEKKGVRQNIRKSVRKDMGSNTQENTMKIMNSDEHVSETIATPTFLYDFLIFTCFLTFRSPCPTLSPPSEAGMGGVSKKKTS